MRIVHVALFLKGQEWLGDGLSYGMLPRATQTDGSRSFKEKTVLPKNSTDLMEEV